MPESTKQDITKAPGCQVGGANQGDKRGCQLGCQLLSRAERTDDSREGLGELSSREREYGKGGWRGSPCQLPNNKVGAVAVAGYVQAPPFQGSSPTAFEDLVSLGYSVIWGITDEQRKEYTGNLNKGDGCLGICIAEAGKGGGCGLHCLGSALARGEAGASEELVDRGVI